MRSLLAFSLFVLTTATLSARADHISAKPKKAPAAVPRVCMRDQSGLCKADTIGLNELSGQWRGNLTVTDAAEFRKFAKESGLCKDASCSALSPYLSFGLAMQEGNARFTLKAFNQGSAGMALTGRNSVRLTPSKDGFMIRRRMSHNDDDSTMQIRMQLEEGPKPSLIVKIFVRGNVVAHGAIAG